MSQLLNIDFVSDISCPWCAIGLASLLEALERLPAAVPVSLNLQPFELNPDLPEGVQDLAEHLTQKYGSTPEQQAAARATLCQRGAAVGAALKTIENWNRYRRASEPGLLVGSVEDLGGRIAVFAAETEGGQTLEFRGLNIDFRLLDGLLGAKPIGAFGERRLLEAVGKVAGVHAPHLEIGQGQTTRGI